jgi:hypothetical protein
MRVAWHEAPLFRIPNNCWAVATFFTMPDAALLRAQSYFIPQPEFLKLCLPDN